MIPGCGESLLECCDKQVVLTADAEFAPRVGEDDRLGSLREDRKPAAERMWHAERDEINAEIGEDAGTGGVQPLAGEAGGLGMRVDEADAGAGFGEREGGRAAYRPAADNGHISGDVRWVSVACPP